MKRPHPLSTCWEGACLPVALTRNPERHVHLANELLDAVPPEWTRIVASVVVERDGDSRCRVDGMRDDLDPASDACVELVHDAICDLARGAIIPDDPVWVGIFVDYDVDSGMLTSTIMHGGTGGGSPAVTGASAARQKPPEMLSRGSGLVVTRRRADAPTVATRIEELVPA